MDAVLASFCFDTQKTAAAEDTRYYGMPPVCFRSIGASFVPDYSIFFLCDSFYVDDWTIERVEKSPAFREHHLLFTALRSLGRLQVVDYRKIVQPYNHYVDASVKHDLDNLGQWSEPFERLVDLWIQLERLAEKRNNLHLRFFGEGEATNTEDMLAMVRGGMIPGVLDSRIRDNLRNWKKGIPHEYREYTRKILSPYLRHISATLCLSDTLNGVLHDWSDIAPLYQKKLTDSVRVQDALQFDKQGKCRQLIQIMFPEGFRPKSASSLAKALEDRRIESLRRLVDHAVRDHLDFDAEFANQTLRDVLSGEEKIEKARNVIGWLVTPVSMIPWVGHVAEKGVEKVIEKSVKARFRRENEWFFFLSEINTPQTK